MFKVKFFKNNLKASILILFFVIFLSLFFYQIFFIHEVKITDDLETAENNLKKVDEIVAKCSDFSDWRGCYLKQFDFLAKMNTLNHTIEILESLQSKDAKLLNCHSIAHNIVSIELGKNPDDWLSLAKTVDPYDCANGYMHGLLEGLIYAQKISIKKDSLEGFCKKIQDNLEGDKDDLEINCFHNIGHLEIVENQGNVNKAIEGCSGFKTFQRSYYCYTGVFMEEFGRAGLVDHGIKPKQEFNWANTEKEEGLCRSFEGGVAQACWRELVTMYRSLAKNNPSGLFENCSRAGVLYRDECYSYGLYLMVSEGKYKDDSLKLLCDPLVSRRDAYEFCLKIVIIALANESKNLDLVNQMCAAVQEPYRNYCHDQAIDRFNIQSEL